MLLCGWPKGPNHGELSRNLLLFTNQGLEKGDTTVTDYTQKRSFIKIINDTHFAFLSHDLAKGKDSLASYSSGGGKYEIKGNKYPFSAKYNEGAKGSLSATITSPNPVNSFLKYKTN